MNVYDKSDQSNLYLPNIILINPASTYAHWRRLVKNTGWANQNIVGAKGGKNDKCMGDSQLLGAHARAPPKSMPMLTL